MNTSKDVTYRYSNVHKKNGDMVWRGIKCDLATTNYGSY